MKRNTTLRPLPAEDPLQDEIWDDESPAAIRSHEPVRPRRLTPWSFVAYWTQWLALTLFGPAQLDAAHDPVEVLKRRYGRPPSE